MILFIDNKDIKERKYLQSKNLEIAKNLDSDFLVRNIDQNVISLFPRKTCII